MSFFLSLFSSLLLILSFPKFNLWIFAWFGFVPLFFAIEDKKPFQRFLFSYLTGIIFFFGSIYWLYHVSILGLILLVLYLALYFGLFGLTIVPFTEYLIPFTVPAIWVLLEYLRSHLFTGFGWALLGYSQYLNIPIIQIADITGVWGVSFLVMMVNIIIYVLLKSLRLPNTLYHLPQAAGDTRFTVHGTRNIIIISLVILTVILGYGFFRLNQKINGQRLKVSAIQGNIPQEIKWEELASDFILDRYFELTMRAKKDRPDLIIWPEASFPGTLTYPDKEEIKHLINLAEEIKISLLIGVVIREENLYFNSAILIKPEKEILRYDKLHLVPFGEYIPLKKIFRFLETIYSIGDFTTGKEYTIFKIPNSKFQIPNKSQPPNHKIQNSFSVLICFEDIFPQVSREFVRRGADFLVVITNDAWFGKTSAPYQHLQPSVFRAVENRIFLVRSANTGISCFINPNGKILSKVSNKRDIFISGYKTENISLDKKNLTFYTRFGDYFVFLCLIIFSYGIIKHRLRES